MNLNDHQSLRFNGMEIQRNDLPLIVTSRHRMISGSFRGSNLKALDVKIFRFC